MKKILLLIIALNIFTHCSTNQENNKIKVAVFNGNGASSICVLETLAALKIDKQIEAQEISAADIIRGKLNNIDVLIFPGGSGSKELNNLGTKGVQIVKKFVNNGKSIIGICAGAYLLSTTPTYPSLQLAAAKNIDRKHYSRGRGLIEFSLTKDGYKIFPELKGYRLFIQYYDGPVLEPLDSTKILYTEIAKYVSDIHANKGTPKGITPGKTFMLTQKIGKGQIFLIAGHPEATPGMRWIIPRTVRYITGNKIVKYPSKWIRPQLYTKEILFTDSLKKVEKKLFWQLLNDTPQIRITAMEHLHNLHSRPAVRWTIGLLRDTSSKVRLIAAKILKEAEYTPAIYDLKIASIHEKNQTVKKQLQNIINFLSEP